MNVEQAVVYKKHSLYYCRDESGGNMHALLRFIKWYLSNNC